MNQYPFRYVVQIFRLLLCGYRIGWFPGMLHHAGRAPQGRHVGPDGMVSGWQIAKECVKDAEALQE